MGEKHIPEKDLPPAKEDHVSDPKLSDETGHDWTDEGGATEQGAATGQSEKQE